MKTRCFALSFIHVKFTYIIALFAVLLNACTINRPIIYPTSDIKPSHERPLSHLSVTFMEFKDIRREVAGNELQFKDYRQAWVQDKVQCINSERHYKNPTVSKQLTLMLVEHLESKKTFKRIQMNSVDSCDYVITASVARFKGLQPVPALAKLGAPFGLIGAVAASVARSVAKTSFAITDIKVHDKNMVLVKDLGSFAMEYEEELFVDAECWCIYANINDKLKEFNKEFVQFLETELAAIR